MKYLNILAGFQNQKYSFQETKKRNYILTHYET